MAFDAYVVIKDPDVEGETKDKVYAGKKAFEIYSFSFGASNPSTIGSGTGGAGAGRVTVSSFNIMKKTDKASRQLFMACCTGDHFGEATVTLRKAGGQATGQVEFLTYKFTEVYVDSIQWSGSTGGDDTPAESVSLSFGKVQIEYNPQGVKGGGEGAAIASWDITTNTPG